MPAPKGRFAYRSVRQHHIGDALDALEFRGFVANWRLVFAAQGRQHWDADRYVPTLAWWCIRDHAEDERYRYKTAAAERYIANLCSRHKIEWLPVPPPGGIEVGTVVRELLVARAHKGADVLDYAMLEEHLKWAGIYFPALPQRGERAREEDVPQ